MFFTVIISILDASKTQQQVVLFLTEASRNTEMRVEAGHLSVPSDHEFNWNNERQLAEFVARYRAETLQRLPRNSQRLRYE